MGKLDGQVALITGGGTGIGAGIAVAYAAEGARVVICGRREAPLKETLGQIEKAGGDGRAVVADVSQADAVDRLVKETIATYGTIDILVNNAGIGGGNYLHEHSIEEWDKIIAVNLRGPFLMARAVLPVMRERRRGHIVNISSESGIEYYVGDGAYGVSKHALNAMAEIMQRENQEHGIHVHAICPGMVVTEMTENSAGLNQDKCLYPEDIADLALWLVTRRQNIKIAGTVMIQTMENPWE